MRGAVVVRRPQLGLKAIRVAGVREQLLSLGEVVRPRAELDVVLDTLRHHAGGGKRIATERYLCQCILVDGVGDRLAHLGIIEGLLLGVHRQVAQHDRWRRHHLELRLRLQRFRLLIRDGISEVRFAGLHHCRPRIVVDDRLPGDRVHLGIALLPVAVELGDLQIVGALPFDEFEWAGPDRIGRDVLAVLGHRRRADHHARRVREIVQERGKGRLQGDLRRVIVDDFGLADIAVKPIALQLVVGIGDAIEIGLDRGGIEVRAVVKLDALLELDGVGETVLGDLVALGEDRNHLHVFVESVQAFVERLGHRLRQRVVGVVRVGGGKRRRHREDDVLGGMRGRRE